MSKDMSGVKCTNCKKGIYKETTQMDDLCGVLHCNKCNHEIQRHIKTKKEIELHKVYDAIKETIAKTKIESLDVVDYCQSWWLNEKNHELGKEMNTPKINRLAKKLVEGGYLTIDKSKTSTSTGTCYKLTDKIF